MTLLSSKTDFIWYKKKLDIQHKIEFEHVEEPKQYPCKVHSKIDMETDWSSRRGATDKYYHYFIYQEEQVCDMCGHRTKVWPTKQIEDAIEDA